MRDVLTRKQQRAAQLRGRGWSLREIAKELGVSTRTLVRWNRLPAFRSERDRTQAEMQDEKPLSLRQTLEAGLLATKPSGSPDWPTRVAAARVLASMPPEDAEGNGEVVVERRIFVHPDGSSEEVVENASANA